MTTRTTTRHTFGPALATPDLALQVVAQLCIIMALAPALPCLSGLAASPLDQHIELFLLDLPPFIADAAPHVNQYGPYGHTCVNRPGRNDPSIPANPDCPLPS